MLGQERLDASAFDACAFAAQRQLHSARMHEYTLESRHAHLTRGSSQTHWLDWEYLTEAEMRDECMQHAESYSNRHAAEWHGSNAERREREREKDR